MMTLKFHNKSTDNWEVLSADRYSVAVIEDKKWVLASDESFPINSCGGFDVCYVVNELGNTVDRIFP